MFHANLRLLSMLDQIRGMVTYIQKQRRHGGKMWEAEGAWAEIQLIVWMCVSKSM